MNITINGTAYTDPDEARKGLEREIEAEKFVHFWQTEDYRYRANADGTCGQYGRLYGAEGWLDSHITTVAAFRAGIAAGREDAKELADMVIGCVDDDGCYWTLKGRQEALALAQKLVAK